MEIDEIIQLIETVSRKNIAEFEIEQGGIRLRITKKHKVVAEPNPEQTLAGRNPYEKPQVMIEMETPSTNKAEEPVPQGAASALESPPEGMKKRGVDLHYVKSPIVGTFYRAPDPNSESYVNVGDKVRKRAVLCIVEAMKLMNEIESDVNGEIVEICIENGSPVEYGEALFGVIAEPGG